MAKVLSMDADVLVSAEAFHFSSASYIITAAASPAMFVHSTGVGFIPAKMASNSADLTAIGEVRGWSAFSLAGKQYLSAAIFKSPADSFVSKSPIFRVTLAGEEVVLTEVASIDSKGQRVGM